MILQLFDYYTTTNDLKVTTNKDFSNYCIVTGAYTNERAVRLAIKELQQEVFDGVSEYGIFGTDKGIRLCSINNDDDTPIIKNALINNLKKAVTLFKSFHNGCKAINLKDQVKYNPDSGTFELGGQPL